MELFILDKALGLLNKISELVNKVLDTSDPKKYADAVVELNQGVSSTYDVMRDVIKNSEQFSDEVKIEKLRQLAELQMNSNKCCDEAIQGNREKVAKVTMDVFKGFLTCGLSFAPAIIKMFKSALKDEEEYDFNYKMMDDIDPIFKETGDQQKQITPQKE